MKAFRWYGLVVACLGFLAVQGQNRVEADFSYARFVVPGEGPYVETYLNFNGTSIGYAPTPEGAFQGRLELTYIFSKNDSVVTFSKNEILSPPVYNPDSGVVDFVDVQRFRLPPGTWDMRIYLKDLVADTRPIDASQPITVVYKKDELQFSDIEPVASQQPSNAASPMVKGGQMLVPYVFDFYPTDMSKLRFYTELYHSDIVFRDQPFIVKYFLRNMGTGEFLETYGGFRKLEPRPVNAMLAGINIEELPTGNYRLIVQCIDSAGQLRSESSIGFERLNNRIDPEKLQASLSSGSFESWVNGINDRDSLMEMVSCLRPISNGTEETFISSTSRVAQNAALKKFFIDFWVRRDEQNPGHAWREYDKLVQVVNREYSTIRTKGYETDRGITYLKYGPPNTIVKRENEPSSYPYHIWHYYTHPRRSDAKYVFYTTSLAANDYVLLHSNVIGELNNRRWQRDLQIRNTPFGNVDDEEVEGNWGSWSDDMFEMPR